MRIAIYSDLHVEFGSFQPPPSLEADVVVLAGDILTPGSRAIRWMSRASVFGRLPIVFVAGNHEYYGRELLSEELGMRVEAGHARGAGVHFLQCDEVVIQGVRFLGCTLWTDFELAPPGRSAGELGLRKEFAMRECAIGLNDYVSVRATDDVSARLLRPADTLAIHWQHRDWLGRKLREPHAGPTVVVTHHAPHRGSLAQRFASDPISAGFVSELPDAFFETPDLWVHGHTHDSFDYTVINCRIVCNPRGYPNALRSGFENGSFDSFKVVELAR
jgi:predicted phosphodiesterase